MLNLFKKLFEILLVILVLIYIIFEELVWEKTAKPIFDFFSKFILKFNIIERLILKINSLNSYIILFIFLLFFVIVELFGIFAAILFVRGDIVFAIFIYILKLPFAVIILWFFDITKDKLLKFRWFEILYDNLIYLKNKIKNSKIYLMIFEKISNTKEYIFSKFSLKEGSIKDKIIKIYKNIKAKF